MSKQIIEAKFNWLFFVGFCCVLAWALKHLGLLWGGLLFIVLAILIELW